MDRRGFLKAVGGLLAGARWFGLPASAFTVFNLPGRKAIRIASTDTFRTEITFRIRENSVGRTFTQKDCIRG